MQGLRPAAPERLQHAGDAQIHPRRADQKAHPGPAARKAERRSGALYHQNAEAEDRGHPRRLRQGGGAGKTGKLTDPRELM